MGGGIVVDLELVKRRQQVAVRQWRRRQRYCRIYGYRTGEQWLVGRTRQNATGFTERVFRARLVFVVMEFGVTTAGGRVLVTDCWSFGEWLRCVVVDGRQRLGAVRRCAVGCQLVRGERGRRSGVGQLLLRDLSIVTVVLRLRVGRREMGDELLDVRARRRFVRRYGVDEVRFRFGATTVLAGRQGEVLRLRVSELLRGRIAVCRLRVTQWWQQIVAERGWRERRRRIDG